MSGTSTPESVERVADITAQGFWSNDALLQTLQQFRGVGADADLSDEVRFLVGVASLVRKRIDQGESDDKSQLPAIFLLHPDPPTCEAGRRYPMLDNGLERITGRIWFVNQVASDGTAIDVSAELDDHSLFQFTVEDLSAGALPAVIFEVRTPSPEIRFYPDGLRDTSNYRLLRIERTSITPDDVFEVIDRLHEQYLCTPDVQGRAGKLWSDSSRSFVADDAEDEIQIVLRNGLTGRFPTCIVRAEQVQPTGRLDVEIEEPDRRIRSRVIRHAVLELKVLRGRRSSGTTVPERENKTWIEAGVKQASEYRDDKGCRFAALCCFDMRLEPSGQDCFAEVVDLAAQLDVNLRCWYLFSSSKEYRSHRVRIKTEKV
jgi:hypothetical protein